jgi:hypothetical protein
MLQELPGGSLLPRACLPARPPACLAAGCAGWHPPSRLDGMQAVVARRPRPLPAPALPCASRRQVCCSCAASARPSSAAR